MKKNLEMFKMNKSQMNHVNGGKTRCVSYNRDTNEMKHYEYGNEDVADAREDIIAKDGGRINVACWEE